MHNIKKTDIIVKSYGYVCKGGGSAFGGNWKPKDANSERFLGKPDTIQKNSVTTKKETMKSLINTIAKAEPLQKGT